jgi:glycosyltransferase involved in cell wall biosynthesis
VVEIERNAEQAMRIAHFIATNFVGGPEKQILNHIGRLPQDVHRVMLISFAEHGGYELKREADQRAIECVLLPAEKWRLHAVLAQLLRAYDVWRPDVVCAHGYKAGFYTLLLKMLRRCRYVGFSRGWTSENLKIHLYSLLDKSIIRFADSIVAVSESQRLRLREAWVPDRKIHVVENAVTVPDQSVVRSNPGQTDIRRELGLAEEARIILAAGRLSPEKGYDDLLRAMILVREKVPSAHLLMAGTGPMEATLRAQVSQSGLESCVHFLGFRKDILNLYGQSDVLALSSLSEGLPNVVLESMALGLPVVATRVGGLPEIIKDGSTGLLVASRASGELAAGLARILTEATFAKEISTRAREDVYRRFAPQVQTERLLQVYREAIES